MSQREIRAFNREQQAAMEAAGILSSSISEAVYREIFTQNSTAVVEVCDKMIPVNEQSASTPKEEETLFVDNDASTVSDHEFFSFKDAIPCDIEGNLIFISSPIKTVFCFSRKIARRQCMNSTIGRTKTLSHQQRSYPPVILPNSKVSNRKRFRREILDL